MRIRTYAASFQQSLAIVFLAGVVWAISANETAWGQGRVFPSFNQKYGVSKLDLIYKVKIGPIVTTLENERFGKKYSNHCQVISTIQGEPCQELDIWWRKIWFPDPAPVKEGEVFIIKLDGEEDPTHLLTAMKGVEEVVEPDLGKLPLERLLAELSAMLKSDDEAMRVAAIRQLGILRDPRMSDEINAAATSKNDEIARAGLIAQYQLKILPDAQRVVEVLNEEMLRVWSAESGTPQKDEFGFAIIRRERGKAYVERGLPSFDYALYLREGIKLEWIHKKDETLSSLFGATWVVQRKGCVPELVKLLDHPDPRVQAHSVKCLIHTVRNQHRSTVNVDDPDRLQKEVTSWRKWWQEEGLEYLAEPPEK